MNNTRTLPSLLGFVAIFLFANCNLTDDGKDTVVKVTPEFKVDLFEELKDIRNFQFKIKTIEPQTCINNSIDFSSSRTLSHLSVSLNEVVQALDCIEGLEPVSAEAQIGYLANGRYEVTIGLKNTIINEGVLDVTPEAFKLSMSTINGFELVRTELKRIPNRFVWGYVGFNDKDQAGQLPDNFLEELNNMTGASGLEKGFYGYFTINNDKVAVLNTPPPYSYFKTFYRQTDGNIDAIKSMLESYRTGNNASLMEIKLFTWDGKTL
jgi:hypothetical protein